MAVRGRYETERSSVPLRPQPATRLDFVIFRLPDVRTGAASRHRIAAQFGNFSAFSIAWKRGLVASTSNSGSIFRLLKPGSRKRIRVSSHSSAFGQIASLCVDRGVVILRHLRVISGVAWSLASSASPSAWRPSLWYATARHDSLSFRSISHEARAPSTSPSADRANQSEGRRPSVSYIGRRPVVHR